MLLVGAYSDNLENAGPSSPLSNDFVTSGGWGGSALAGWQQVTSTGTRTDKYRVSSNPVAISTVGFIAAATKVIESESAVGQTNLPPFVQKTDTDGTNFMVVPNGTGDVNSTSVTNLNGIAAYNFNLSADSDVTIDARVLFANFSEDSFWHRMDGGPWTKQQGSPSAGWQWLSFTNYPSLASGDHTFEIVRSEDGAKIDQFRFTPSAGSVAFITPPPVYPTFGNGGTPGTGNPWPISDTVPTRIEAENYDHGNDGQTYHDTTTGNIAGAFRSDGVDIETTTDTGGGFNVGNVVNGEWLQYTVNVAKATSYRVNLRVARQTAGTAKIRVTFDGVDKTSELTVPNTTTWQNFVNLPVTVKLDAGRQVMRVEFLSNSQNLNYVEFVPLLISNPWQQTAIGSPRIEGDAIFDNGTFTLSSACRDIHGQSDSFHYVYQAVTGNCEIIARVASMDNTNAGAKAGVMIRDTLNADSRHFSTFVTPSQGILFSRRLNTGGFSTTDAATSLTTPCWVKIKRVGSLFTSSYSQDGVTWIGLGTQGFSLSSILYIGLAVTSKNETTICSATFDNVSIPTPVARAGEDFAVTDTDASGSEIVTLDGSASTAGTGSINSYSWKQGSTQIATGINPQVNLALGPHTLTLTITTSTGASTSTSVTITVVESNPLTLVAINAGGPSHNSADGISYRADMGFTGGSTFTTTADISNTSDPEIYRTERWGNFTWSHDIPNGSYTLVLKFAEIANSVNSPGQRIFDVSVEGRKRITNLDILASAIEKDTAYDLELPVTVTDGSLDLTFSPTANNAKISAIVIRTVPYPDANSNGIPDTWESEFFGIPVSATSDNDHDGSSNLSEYIAGTSPIDPHSLFSIGSVVRTQPAGFTLRWDSVAGRSYRVMRSTSLSNNWTTISDLLPGTGGELSFTDTSSSAPKNFYRMQISISTP